MDQILDAARNQIQTAGYSSLTTTDVADEAGVPIGTLYQFFEDKRALAHELAERNWRAYLIRIRDQTSRRAPAQWEDLADIIATSYTAMWRETPAFRRIGFGGPMGISDIPTGGIGAGMTEALGDVIREQFGRDPDALNTLFELALISAEATYHRAYRDSTKGDPGMIRDAEDMLRSYLASI